MARYPRTFRNSPVSNRLLRFYHTLSAVAAVETVVAAAQQQQQEPYTAAAVHICRAPYLSWRRAGFRQACIVRRNMQRWAAKATEINRHTTRMKIRGSVVS